MPLSPANTFSAGSHRWPRLPAVSRTCQPLEDAIRRVGLVGCTTLITGETGCGKGEVARAIHAAGPRSEAAFVPVNCGGLPASLAESQLFGHEKGAFTGAIGATCGAFRAADGGVLFLDEVAELPLELQPMLLDVLERREVTPVGSTRQVPIDVQVIAATNRCLEEAVEQGEFREDLLFRLNTIHLQVPPLRERPEDIPRLISHFAAFFADRHGQALWQPRASTLARLVSCPWPGNVRQLAQAVERHYVFGVDDNDLLESLASDAPGERTTEGTAAPEPAAAPAAAKGAPAPGPAEAEPPTFNLREVRNRTVRAAMAAAGNHFGKAAELLGVAPNTLTKLVAEACPELSRKKRPGHSKRHALALSPAARR